MRRVTSFCVLVASILILIQGARSEPAFRQNDRPPNVLERDADKYNRPQIPSKLPINTQDQTDACPVKEHSSEESVQTTEKGIDSATVLPQCTKRVVRQNPTSRYRRRDTNTREVVRRTVSRRYRRRDMGTSAVIRRTNARRDRRKDTSTRNVARQTASRRNRIGRGTRDVVRHRHVVSRRQTRYNDQLGRNAESRQARRTLSLNPSRSFRRMVDVSVRSRSTAHRIGKRERNSRFSRRDYRNTRGASYTRRTIRDSRKDTPLLTSPYQDNGKVNLLYTDSSYTTKQNDKQDEIHFAGTPTKRRSSRAIRWEVHRSRGDRRSRSRPVADARLSTVSRFPVNEQGHRTDVRRRFRRNDRRAKRNTRRDVTHRFKSVRISTPYDFNAVSVIEQPTMQASKEHNIDSASSRSARRVARRARFTRGYKRISSNSDLEKQSKVVCLPELTDNVNSKDNAVEDIEKSRDDGQYEMMPSERHTSLDKGSVTTEESITTDNKELEGENINGNRVKLQSQRRRQEGHRSRRRMLEKRRVRSLNKSRRFNDVRIRQGSRHVHSMSNSRRDRRHGRSARRHLNNDQHRARRLQRSSNGGAYRRSARKGNTGNHIDFVSDVTRVNTERRTRNKHERRRGRSTRGARRQRVARAAEGSNPSEITDNRTITGDILHPTGSRQQTHTYRYLTKTFGSVRRSRRNTRMERRNSRMEGRRSREFRFRRGRHQVVDRGISERVQFIKGHQNSYLTENNFGMPLFDLVGSQRKPETIVRGMARSRRSRYSERRRKSSLYSPKALEITTKSVNTHPLNKDAHVDPHDVSSKLSGAVDYCLNILVSFAKAFQENEHFDQGTLPDDTSQGPDACFRGVMLGVIALLSTHVVQGVSAPSLPPGQIRHGLLA